MLTEREKLIQIHSFISGFTFCLGTFFKKYIPAEQVEIIIHNLSQYDMLIVHEIFPNKDLSDSTLTDLLIEMDGDRFYEIVETCWQAFRRNVSI